MNENGPPASMVANTAGRYRVPSRVLPPELQLPEVAAGNPISQVAGGKEQGFVVYTVDVPGDGHLLVTITESGHVAQSFVPQHA